MTENLTPIRPERHNGDRRSYPIPVWNGIFEHRRKIGRAIWVFLWCIDRVTKEDSGSGFVFGGAIVPVERIASELDDCNRTIRRHLKRLATLGYLTLQRFPYGFGITVANSRKFGIWSQDKSVRSGPDKNCAKTGQKLPCSTKIVRSNNEDSAVDSAQRQNLPPNPPSGGLTRRQRKDLNKEKSRIAQASQGTYPRLTDDELTQEACARLCLPLDQARKAVAESYGEQTA